MIHFKRKADHTLSRIFGEHGIELSEKERLLFHLGYCIGVLKCTDAIIKEGIEPTMIEATALEYLSFLEDLMKKKIEKCKNPKAKPW